MKDYLIAFSMTQSMFCALPFPCRAWIEEARNKMLLFLPVVGLEIGLLWWGLSCLLQALELPVLVGGLLMCAWPYLSTGFIHLDGFLDVTDAIGSWRPLEKRREILKDSHIGAIAVIWCVFLILAGFALFASAPVYTSVFADTGAKCLILVPMMSRCCSALAVMKLKPMHTSQYAASQGTSPKWHSVFLMLLALASAATGFVCWGKYGLVPLSCLVGYGVALWNSYRLLEGMNGDISGYCITISELCAVAVYALL